MSVMKDQSGQLAKSRGFHSRDIGLIRDREGLWVEKRHDIRYEMQIILYFYHVLSGSVVIIQTHRPKLVITTIPKLTFCRIMVQIQQLLPKRQRMLPFVGRYIPASIMICYCYACCNMSEKISCVNYKDSILLSWQSLIVSCQ